MAAIPNRDWYSAVSQDRRVGLRCPFATVEACPRYYQSLSLLGEAGSTGLPEAEDRRLLKLWQVSDIWPRTAEQATSIAGSPGSPTIYSNFCPEVTFERFGYFATSLTRYVDEIDLGLAHERLARQGAPSEHPGWTWESCTSQHFTECATYAVLLHRSKNPRQKPLAKQEGAESYVDKLKRHPAVATVITVVAIVAGLAALFGNIEKIKAGVLSYGPCSNPIVDERPIHCL